MATATAPMRFRTWPIALGLTGFAAGFLGPMLVNPDANQGPMVGIFITGPGGVIAGLIFGAVAGTLSLPANVGRKALAWICTLFAAATLFYCLPEPTTLATVIDAEITQCEAPSAYMSEATAMWQSAVQRTTWYTPPADWKDTARRNVEAADGVVLTLKVLRRSAILHHRKPWDFHRNSAERWSAVSSTERYYANDEGSDCAGYVTRARQLYAPISDVTYASNHSSAPWPPTDVTGFLRLQRLGPVSGEYQRLLDASK